MRVHRTGLCVASVLVFNILAQAVPYAVFPKAGQLPSPDGRFVVRNIDPVDLPPSMSGRFTPCFLKIQPAGVPANCATMSA